jgi:septum formation protein
MLLTTSPETTEAGGDDRRNSKVALALLPEKLEQLRIKLTAPCHNLNMLILASASPRRRELLTQAGFTFQVHPAHIPEDPNPGEDPIAYVVRLAREKAQAVFAQLVGAPEPALSLSKGLDSETWDRSQNGQRIVVLGADTTVTLDNHILGKPEDPADAARMLRLLSGRTHRVITGVAVVTAERAEVAAEVTGVTFRTLSDEEIDAYIATDEPMDKAGAYAIQGSAARWIPRIQGDYFNVVGLPIALVSTLLESLQPRTVRR